MSEVDVLTARLDVQGLAGFTRSMAQADASVDVLRKNLQGLTTDALAARGALAGLGIGAGPAADAAALKTEVKSVRDAAVPAAAAMKEMKPPDSSVADLAAIKAEVKGIRDAAVEADIALKGMGGGGGRVGGTPSSRSVLDSIEQGNAAELRRIYNSGVRRQFLQEEARLRSGEAMAPTLSDAFGNRSAADIASARNAAELLRLRMQSGQMTSLIQDEARLREVERLGGAIPLGGAPGTTSFADAEAAYREARRLDLDAQRVRGAIPLGAGVGGPFFRERDIRSAFGSLEGAGALHERLGAFSRERVASDVENQVRRDLSHGGILSFLLGSSGGDRVVRDVENGIRGGGDSSGGYTGTGLSGLLPGGRRASAAIVTSLIGAAGVGAVAAGPGILGGATALAAGATTLGGALGTLKLAFADITSAAFNTKTAFDALTPVQQQFVQSLRSLDAGLLHGNLEPLAQKAVLPGLTAALHEAFTPATVQSLQGGVSAFGGAISGGAQQFGRMFGSSSFQQQFGTMLQQDAGYLRVFLSDITSLTDAFVRFQVAGGPFLKWLGDATQGLSQWIDQSVKADAANGRLAQFFDDAKASLQTFGNLFLSVGHLAGGFADAIGFQNSLHFVDLLSTAINDLANLLKQNAHVLNDFFAGAIAAARQILALIDSILGVLHPLLTAINNLIGGTNGWKFAVEGLVAVLTIQWLQGVLTSLGKIGLVETGVGTAAATATGEVSGLRAALIGLGGASVLGALARLAGPLAGIVALVTSKNSQGGGTGLPTPNASYLLSNAFLGSQTGRTIPPALKNAFIAYRAGTLTPLGFEKYLAGHLALLQQYGINITPAEREYAQEVRGGMLNTNPRARTLGPGGHLAVPTGVSGSYFYNYNATPFNPFATPAPFGSTGTGWQLPVQYQVAIVNAQQAGSVAGQIAATKNAIAYINGIYPGLSPANRIAAESEKQSLVSSLQALQGTGSAMSGVGFLSQAAQTTLANAQQTAAGVSGTTPVTSQNLAAVKTLISTLKTDHATIAAQIQKGAYAGVQRKNAVAEELALTNQLVAAQKTLTGLQLQVPPGQAARLQQALQRTSGITATSPATDQTITALNGLLVQQVATMKDLVAEMRKAGSSSEKQAAERQVTTLKDQHAATVKLRDSLEATRQEAKVLGISSAPGAVSAARETSTVRTSVNALLKQFGLAQTGSSPLGPFVSELYKMGDINKRQYESLEKILTVITDAKKSGDKIATAITGNISSRLAEIKQELQAQTGFTLTGAQRSVSGILRMTGAHLGGTAAQRSAFLEAAQYAQAHHGEVLSTRGAALGIPYGRSGAPSLTHKLDLTVTVKGGSHLDKQAAKEIANLVAHQLRRTSGRNTTQMTGSNAGVNTGL